MHLNVIFAIDTTSVVLLYLIWLVTKFVFYSESTHCVYLLSDKYNLIPQLRLNDIVNYLIRQNNNFFPLSKT